jgi:hypothetical protein
MLDAFLYDMSYAARTLRRNVSLAGVTAVTLGLGIGSVTALFAVIHAVLLQPIAARSGPRRPDLEAGRRARARS